MRKIHILTSPGTSKMLDYVVNIYQNDTFVKAYRFEGYSGHATSDEVFCLKHQYPASEGYSFSMTWG